MWSGWARDLGTRLELATRRPVAGDVFAAIGFDPVADRDPARRAAGGRRRWARSRSSSGPSSGAGARASAAARRILAEAWFEPDPVERAVPLADLAGAVRRRSARAAGGSPSPRPTTARPTEATLAGLGVADLVDDVLCGDDDGPTKPEPGGARRPSPTGSASPIGRTAMVGDTPADLRMARAAGAAASIGVRERRRVGRRARRRTRTSSSTRSPRRVRAGLTVLDEAPIAVRWAALTAVAGVAGRPRPPRRVAPSRSTWSPNALTIGRSCPPGRRPCVAFVAIVGAACGGDATPARLGSGPPSASRGPARARWASVGRPARPTR